LHANAKLELDVVERLAGAGPLFDSIVADAGANANDHVVMIMVPIDMSRVVFRGLPPTAPEKKSHPEEALLTTAQLA
jgi:hypothetical protein